MKRQKTYFCYCRNDKRKRNENNGLAKYLKKCVNDHKPFCQFIDDK